MNEGIYGLQRGAHARIEDAKKHVDTAHEMLADKNKQLKEPLMSIVQQICSERVGEVDQKLESAMENASQVMKELYEPIAAEHKRLQKRVTEYVDNEIARRPRGRGRAVWNELYSHADEAYDLDLISYRSNHHKRISPLIGTSVNIIDAAPDMQLETETDALIILLEAAKDVFQEHPD